MSSQRDPNRVPMMCYAPIELVAKIKSHIAGKKVANKVAEGKTVRKPFRPMCPSDFLISMAERRLAKCKMLPQWREWADNIRGRNLERRKRQDERLAFERKKRMKGV